MKRLRLRKWAKWGCTVAAAVVLAVAAFSAIFACSFTANSANDEELRVIGVANGIFCVVEPRGAAREQTTESHEWDLHRQAGWKWASSAKATDLGSEWKGGFGVLWSASDTSVGLCITLGYPLILAALPAALLWYKDRRKPGPHQCRVCG